MKKIMLLVLVLALALACVSLAAEGIWTTKSDMPTARHVLSSSVVDGKIYAIGGSLGGSACITTVEEYDPVMDIWTRKANMPMARGAGASSAVNGRIYYMGCIPSLYGALYSSVQEYDTTTDTWTAKADMTKSQVAPKNRVFSPTRGHSNTIGHLVKCDSWN
ncbi:MAG: hypothetical protein JSW66_06295 [Phycisphaerales bacterium]|nr:MAG: hypothetical protein JSW66_06295 [Phycisphaerales bacterium]